MKLAVFLTLAASAAADIIYLANCNAAGSPFGFRAAVFHTGGGAGNGQLNPSTGNIGIAGSEEFWGQSEEIIVIYPDTQEVLVVQPLNDDDATVGFVAGTASNRQGKFTCRRDTDTQLFNNGFITCDRNFFCQPVSDTTFSSVTSITRSWTG
ncbi:hypothetical protein NA57DRAFT_74724 [Rhizodiscina lignyota]|uniref:Uncharacterized protein n=1 Tax=Rhizodiscina lignyota TaxID=1504668 RepID=A0A9P4IKW2_9PEZI|nr:hypothetical protein NA57DRAFT_74724 [Rhizodiscina lignyota]